MGCSVSARRLASLVLPLLLTLLLFCNLNIDSVLLCALCKEQLSRSHVLLLSVSYLFFITGPYLSMVVNSPYLYISHVGTTSRHQNVAFSHFSCHLIHFPGFHSLPSFLQSLTSSPVPLFQHTLIFLFRFPISLFSSRTVSTPEVSVIEKSLKR